MAWIYLFIASCFEICWTYCIKFLNFRDLFKKPSLAFFLDYHNSLPLAGYIIFGIANIIFFSMAVKQISPSIAFAVWMGVAMLGIKLVDTIYLKQPTSIGQIFFMALILAGIIGLKKTSAA